MIRANMAFQAEIPPEEDVLTGGNLLRCKIADSSDKLLELSKGLHRKAMSRFAGLPIVEVKI